MNLFFTLLAFGAAAAALAVVAALALPAAGWRRLRADIADAALPLALAVAATSMAGSLYYSEVEDFSPCKLCWFQRICMYPLVALLAVAVVRRDRLVRFYALPLSMIGAGVSIYHYQLQQFPSQHSSFCTLETPCTAKEVDQFGFVTIPLMALAGFCFISVLLLSTHLTNRTEESTRP